MKMARRRVAANRPPAAIKVEMRKEEERDERIKSNLEDAN